MPNLITVGQTVRAYVQIHVLRSLKVIGIDTDRSGTYAFLLMTV